MATIFQYYIVEFENNNSHNEIDFDTYNDARNFEDFLISHVDTLGLSSVILKQISEFKDD